MIYSKETETNKIQDSGELPSKERIVRYWTMRSDSFAVQREAELQSELHERWLKLIESELIKTGGAAPLRILDVGTGSGFFAILLAMAGHHVTGIDLTESMIRHAGELARIHGCHANFQVMDAEHLDFPTESFDVVISRNLTWTLPNPEQAYKEWMRVLKNGGILLNYDADYGAACFTQDGELPKEHAHNKVGQSMMQECQSIKDALSISARRRPDWDVSVFRQMGYEKIQVRRDISEHIYLKKDEFYNPVPLFSLKVCKEQSGE